MFPSLTGKSPVGSAVSPVLRGRKPEAGAAWYEVTGVVADVRRRASAETRPEVYLPWGEQYWPLMSIVTRVRGSAAAFDATARAVVRQVDPNQVVEEVKTLDRHVALARREPHVRAWLVGGFALAGLLLASLGLYGVLAAEVASRTQEYGVRLALGAKPAALLVAALRRGMTLACAGMALGLAGAAPWGGSWSRRCSASRRRTPGCMRRPRWCCWPWRAWPACCRRGAPREPIPWWPCVTSSGASARRGSSSPLAASVADKLEPMSLEGGQEFIMAIIRRGDTQ